jgi:hypothetical protein
MTDDRALPDTDGGFTNRVTRLDGRAAYRQAAFELIGVARRQLRVLSQELDRQLWNDPGIVDLLREFALRSTHAELRILVNQPQRIAQRGHRLVELARQLPSRIAIRELNEEHRGIVEEFAVADERALLCKRRHDDPDAQWSAQAPPDARRLVRRYDRLWDEAVPARELAILGL